MALYSVWDWDRNSYRVYTTPTHVSVGDDPVPPKPLGVGPIGANPDTDVKPLPSGAKFIGYDHFARGEIRRASSNLLDLGDDAGTGGSLWTQPLVMFVAGAAAVVVFYQVWKKPVKKNRRSR